MRSALLLLGAGASFAFAQAEGVPAAADAAQALTAQDTLPLVLQSNVNTGDAGEKTTFGDAFDAATKDTPLVDLGVRPCGGHVPCGGSPHKWSDPKTVTATVTKSVSIIVPDPTTSTKYQLCTTTVVRSRTLTKCINHTKTAVEYIPKYTTKTSTEKVTRFQTKTSVQYVPQYTTRTSVQTSVQYVPQYTTRTSVQTSVQYVPTYSTRTSVQYVPTYVTQTVPTYITRTVTSVVDPGTSCPQPGRPCSGGNCGGSGSGSGSDSDDDSSCGSGDKRHTVQRGDHCWKVAQFYDISVDNLKDHNSWLTTKCDLELGDILCIPSQKQVKRDVAHHHHRHHLSCEEEPSDPECDGGHHGHHHHGHHHKHHHHKHHGHHHHGHHHHHHDIITTTTITATETETTTTTETVEATPTDPWGGDSGSDAGSCGHKHSCVPCARPGVCPRGGMHSSCPPNHSCQEM